MQPQKSFYIENLGCAKNQVDAEIMGAALERAGWTWEESADTASLILINSCGFIEPAQVESVNTTLDAIDAYPDRRIIMTGCLAQRYPTEIAAEIPELAGVFGNREPERIVELAEGTDGSVTVLVPDGRGALPAPRRSRLLSHPGSAYVKIAEGCDHRCSFCAIPDIRGTLRTRAVEDIVSEIDTLRTRGVFEFNLVAQDLAAYNNPDLTTLLDAVASRTGEFWIRPLYVYPDAFPLELVRRTTRDERFLPYFDIPLQHASGSVLRGMGRSGDGASHRTLVEKIRTVQPDAVIRSSFIVGFPGETEDDIDELAEFLQNARLEWAGFFAYSPQEGTPAMRLVERDGIPDAAVVASRIARLQEIQETVTTERLARFVGRTVTVLLEEPVRGSDLFLARAAAHAPEVDGLVIVHTDGRDGLKPGDVVRVRVRNVRGVDWNADLI